MAQNVAEMVPFGDLCKCLDAIGKTKGADARRIHLRKFIESWRKADQVLHEKNSDLATTDDSFYPAMRLILPSYDKERGNYGFKETHLLVGDFAATAANVLRLRLATNCSLMLSELNDRLDKIVLANAEKQHDVVKQQLQLLCRSVTEVEMKWLIRILLKQMKVCQKLHNPSISLDEIQITLFHPFRPMLAQRAPPEKVPQIMENKPFYVETKYDGERVQVHKEKSVYNGNDFTTSYGCNPTSGSLTPYIHSIFPAHVKSCILDAEMVGWNPIAECIATKGEQFDVKSLRPGDDLQPCLVLFDCLMLNGTVLCTKPLSERIALLKTVLKSEIPGRVILGQRKVASDVNELIAHLNAAIENRDEGLVIKRMDSAYKLNTRSESAGWLKIKPDYIDALNDDFDLLIVGGYFGVGARANLMSHFLLAVADGKEGQAHPTSFQSVCKVGSGYSHKELFDLNRRLFNSPQILRAKDQKTPPEWLKIGYEKPDVYIKPESSKIVQVRAAEITASSGYATGYTLRFPRVQKVRDDKDWHECMTLEEFEKMRLDSAGKTSHQHFYTTSNFGTDPSPPKKRRPDSNVNKRRIVPSLAEGMKFDKTVAVTEKVVDVFEGKEICVMASEVSQKRNLELLVKKLGGRLSQNANEKTFCVITDCPNNFRVKNLIKTGQVTVASADWLKLCFDREEMVDWTPAQLYATSPAHQMQLSLEFDDFGDSYKRDTAPEDMARIFEKVARSSDTLSNASKELILQLEEDYNLQTEFSVFRGMRFYIDNLPGNLEFTEVHRDPESQNQTPDTQKLSEISARHLSCIVRLYGGGVVNTLAECSHAVVVQGDPKHDDTLLINETNARMDVHFRVVDADWVRGCVGSGAGLS